MVSKLTVEFLRTDGSLSGKIMCFNMLFLARGIALTGYGTSETESMAADRLLRLQSDPPIPSSSTLVPVQLPGCGCSLIFLLPELEADTVTVLSTL